MCVTDVGVAVTNLRVVCKSITCVPAFHRNGNGHIKIFLDIVKSCCWSGHSGLLATRRMPLWAFAIALSTGKNTTLVGVLDQNKTRFFTYVSQRAESMQGSHCRDKRLAWVASRWQGLRAHAHSSRKSWERTARELTTFIL